jgi:cyclopropane fatty-acyl-phospholipid synthase-like methyltransferase
MNELTAKTGEFFEDYANQFDEIYTIQTQQGFMGWLNRSLRASMLIRYKKTFSLLQPMEGCTVIDIGCGSGRYLLKCLELGAAKVTGIDLSEEMLSLSRKALDSSGNSPDRVELMCGDFLKCDVWEPYDYAIVMGVMDYIENSIDFLAKLKKTVRGKAALSFPVAESVWALQRKIRYKLRGCPLYFYRRRQLEKLIECLGFKSFFIERIARDYFVAVHV